MGFLYFLVDLFLNTFGITQPSEQKRRGAAFFILALLCLVVAVATIAFLTVRASMR